LCWARGGAEGPPKKNTVHQEKYKYFLDWQFSQILLEDLKNNGLVAKKKTEFERLSRTPPILLIGRTFLN